MADELTARGRLAQVLLGSQPSDDAMAAPAAAPAAAFQWGQGGARLTSDQIAARQRVVDAMMQQGTDASPLPTGTRGAGVWTQGLARVAKGLVAGMEQRDLDQQSTANDKRTTDLLLSNPALGGGAGATATPAATPAIVADGSAPRGIRNNNPLNIEDGPFAQSQPGYAGTDGRFAKFETPDHGTAAASNLLDTYQNKYGLNTVSGVVNRWAPTSDGNNVSAYAQDVAGRLGIDPNAPLTPQQRPALIAAMGQHENGQPIQMPAPSSGVARVATALGQAPAAPVAPTATPPQVPPQQAAYIRQLIVNPETRAAGVAMLAQYQKPRETYGQQTDADGNIWSVNNQTGQRTVALKASEDPSSVREYQFYQKNVAPGQPPMDYATWSTAKARAGATNVSTNVDTKSGDTYDQALVGGLAKSHAGLANGVEDAQTRYRDINAMQAAVDTIQKNGGTTGGLGQEKVLDLQKSINSGANALGIGQVFNENDLSDKEILSKLNRQIAGAQAKSVGGARVTNFELGNYINSNPGLSLSPTANQRLLGIQAQIEQRNIAVGNAIRNATAAAVAKGQKIDPQTVQGLITSYDQMHPVRDPVNHQDLTQSYAIPDLQAPSSNDALAVGHEANINGIRIKRIN